MGSYWRDNLEEQRSVVCESCFWDGDCSRDCNAVTMLEAGEIDEDTARQRIIADRVADCAC